MVADACCRKHDWLIEALAIDVYQAEGINNMALVHRRQVAEVIKRKLQRKKLNYLTISATRSPSRN